jgi:C4-dicarboxylate-specific signal transduction histidine kinase
VTAVNLADLSIKRKLIFLGAVTAGVIVVLLGTFLALMEWHERRSQAATELTLDAAIVSDNAAHAVLFGDEKTASDVLAPLLGKANIVYASILDKAGRPLAEFERVHQVAWPESNPQMEKVAFYGSHALLVHELKFDGERIGTLFLQRDMSVDYRKLASKMVLIALATLLSLLAAAIFFVRLQRGITEPLRVLTDQMERVTRNNDYSVRVPITSRDEFGTLGQGFNLMLETIGERDKVLEIANEHLEKIVHERTRELERANADLHGQVAERERAEQQLKVLNENLEQLVQYEVAQNREKDHLLIQQSRLAAMGEMVHNIAHQWRQPLNALGLVIQNLSFDFQDGVLDKETMDRQVEVAMELILGMSSTIDDFRQFFSPDRQPSDFDIGHAVDRALTVIEPALTNNYIGLEKHLEPGLMASGYPNQFSQVVLNIVGNAKDAITGKGMKNGAIFIRLGTENGKARLTIEDNGGGIPAEILPKIFDPYFTSKEKGSGIGLYMSKTIVERNMDGTIAAENVDGRARFTIELPLAGG